MFEVTEQRCTLTSVNPRAEIHGDEPVPAVDLGLTMDVSNDVLVHFGSQLKASLYTKAKGAAPAASQGELDVVAPISDMPHLKNPCLEGALKIRFDGVGYQATIDYGLGGASNIELAGVKVNGIRITPKEGGTVSLALRLQVSDPDSGALGHLCTMVGNEVTVTLAAPEADQPRLAA